MTGPAQPFGAHRGLMQVN